MRATRVARARTCTVLGLSGRADLGIGARLLRDGSSAAPTSALLVASTVFLGVQGCCVLGEGWGKARSVAGLLGAWRADGAEHPGEDGTGFEAAGSQLAPAFPCWTWDSEFFLLCWLVSSAGQGVRGRPKVSREERLLPGAFQGAPPDGASSCALRDQPSQRQQLHFGLSCRLAPCNSSVTSWGGSCPHERHSPS